MQLPSTASPLTGLLAEMCKSIIPYKVGSKRQLNLMAFIVEACCLCSGEHCLRIEREAGTLMIVCTLPLAFFSSLLYRKQLCVCDGMEVGERQREKLRALKG